MIFAKQENDSEENRKRELGPREHAGMLEHGEAERGASATSERLADSPIPHMPPVENSKYRALFVNLGALGLIAGAFLLMTRVLPQKLSSAAAPAVSQVSSALPSVDSTSSPAVLLAATTSPKKVVAKKATSTGIKSAQQDNQVHRIANPYPTAALPLDQINASARAALVNILCTPHGGSLKPISGSGIIIDSRGIVLTNAHVAQYVLLSQSPRVDLSCYIRTGSPAKGMWVPHVLYIPKSWIDAHAADINKAHPLGTGEHDYAFLYIASSENAAPLPGSFPSLSPDSREAIGFVDDEVLVASYPAEFLGSVATYENLYPVISVTKIKQLLTFTTRSVDTLSLGGVISAQSGSSGGGIVNAWGRIIGLITTTSEGATTADRDLHAVTMSYINRDLLSEAGYDLQMLLNGDPAAMTADFSKTKAPGLVDKYIEQISR